MLAFNFSNGKCAPKCAPKSFGLPTFAGVSVRSFAGRALAVRGLVQVCAKNNKARHVASPWQQHPLIEITYDELVYPPPPITCARKKRGKRSVLGEKALEI